MIAEQMARRVSIYRKNSMFCGSELGADARACLLTLVETARANGLDPYSYLEFVLERTRGDGFWGDAALMESLMPWSREAQAACARAAAVREPSHAPVGTAA
jgi:hypothetical protein